jgi:hypothetical protein
MLVTSALHMPRAVGCFRVAGSQVEPYPVEFTTAHSHPFAGFTPGSAALVHLDTIAKEWISLIAYGSWARPTRCFPARSSGNSELENSGIDFTDENGGGLECGCGPGENKNGHNRPASGATHNSQNEPNLMKYRRK